MANLEYLMDVVPWTGANEPPEVNMANGPPLPIFFESEYDIVILGIDQESYCYIQLTSIENQVQRNNLQICMRSQFYTKKMQIPLEAINVGDHLLFADSKGLFRRVKVVQLTPGNEVYCLDVDNNTFVKTKVEFLFFLSPDVLSFPIQAIKCEFYDMEILIGTDVLQAVFSSLPEAGTWSCQFLLNKEIPSIRLSMPGRPDLPAADILRKKLPEFCLLPRRIPDLSPVIVTHVDKDGFVWFQYNDRLMDNINLRTETFDPGNYYLSRETMREVVLDALKNKDTIFIAQFKEVFYRAKAVSEVESGELTVDFIDFGNVEKIRMEDLYTASMVDLNLQFIPPQCVKAHLYGIVVLRDVDVFWEKLECQNTKVQVVERGVISEVNIFLENNQRLNFILLESDAAAEFDYRRLAPAKTPPKADIGSCSVMEEKLEIAQEPEAVKEVKALEVDLRLTVPVMKVQSLEHLQPRTMGKLLITDAHSIDCFSLQDIASRNDLEDLERAMCTYYESVKHTSIPLTQQDLVCEGLYAYYCPKMGRWIRARYLGIHPGPIRQLCKVCLRLIDYGYWVTHSIFDEPGSRSLQPLIASHCELQQQGFTATRYQDRHYSLVQVDESEKMPIGTVFRFMVMKREEVSEIRDVPELTVVFLESLPDVSDWD